MSRQAIGVAIPGCAGRMGRALVQAVATAPDLRLSGASERSGAAVVGQDAGSVAGLPPLGVQVTDDQEALLEGAAGVVDFTLPAPTVELARRCAARHLPLVVGTTGFSDEQRDLLGRVARQVPVVLAPNMSVGVNVLVRLVAEAARLLGPEYDLEIVEAHHNQKVDAPSGTALRLAEALAEATAGEGGLAERACYGRKGNIGPRPRREIGIQTVRGGDLVGEHTVMFCGAGERVELVHRASSRQTFAGGALRALRWALGRAPGLYDMSDVLGLR
jgi:4-hydroxy-tetrahydrodipicolinate reductase